MIVGIGKAASTEVMASTRPSGNQATINTQLRGPCKEEGGVLGMVAEVVQRPLIFKLIRAGVTRLRVTQLIISWECAETWIELRMHESQLRSHC